MRIERVDPSAFVGPASRILQEAWQPPCVHYAPEYLSWQFTFPGSSPFGVAAFDGDEPVGFFSALLRRFVVGQNPRRAWLACFGAVRPRWRGVGAARALYRATAVVIRASGLPAFLFTQPESLAERLLVSAFRAERFQARTFGDYRTYACLPQGTAADASFVCSASSADTAFLEVARRCQEPHTLWHDPDLAALAHYGRDPRHSLRVLVHGPGGEAVGAALLARSEAVTAAGTEFSAAVESVFLPQPSAEILAALFRFAAAHYAGQVGSPVVLAPNLRGIDPGLLRKAGARATQSAFRGHLFVLGPADPFAGAEGTNLEIAG
jgi:hypothetical protein